MEEQQEPSVARISREQIILTGGTLLTSGILDIATHNPTTAFFGLCVTFLVARHSGDIVKHLVPGQDAKQVDAVASRVVEYMIPGEYADQSASAKFKRMFGVERGTAIYQLKQEEAMPKDAQDDALDLIPRGQYIERPTVFSAMLDIFTPDLSQIYLATLANGTPVFSDAKGLCHVALAGSTGQGKSNIIRLLTSQLCMAGAQVLLLNPHYTRYDLDAGEDWTPFEPYLVHPPMECRKYEVIEHYLRHIALDNLPKRLDRYANSRPTGKPYFIVIDELPAIVDNIPDAPKYLAKILREGRKVGLFLITAAQDFLVKTIAPQGGGAIRDCYRTAFYVGGDPTTAKILLDMPARDIEEQALGKGTVMLRCQGMTSTSRASVPYVDNQALYHLLGPSTYVPQAAHYEDDLSIAQIQSEQNRTGVSIESLRPNPYHQPGTPARLSSRLPPELQMALNTYEEGMSYREFARALGVGKDKAGELMRELKERRLIVG